MDGETGRLLSAAHTFCYDLLGNVSPHWLVLLGDTGIGKTHLAREVYRFFLERAWGELRRGPAGKWCEPRAGRFYSWRKVCAKLRDGEWDIVDGIKEQWLAVLDDVGAEHDPNGVMRSKLDEICDARLGKWTVFTSNLLLSQIAERLDARIASRMLRGGNVVVGVDPKVSQDFVARAAKNSLKEVIPGL